MWHPNAGKNSTAPILRLAVCGSIGSDSTKQHGPIRLCMRHCGWLIKPSEPEPESTYTSTGHIFCWASPIGQQPDTGPESSGWWGFVVRFKHYAYGMCQRRPFFPPGCRLTTCHLLNQTGERTGEAVGVWVIVLRGYCYKSTCHPFRASCPFTRDLLRLSDVTLTMPTKCFIMSSPNSMGTEAC